MSALSNLFQEIADAIRSKSGGTDTMKPATFPANILALNTSTSAAGVQHFEGKFTATATTMTVEHDMGVVPDILVVYANAIPVNGYLIMSAGYSAALMTALGNADGSQYLAASLGYANGGSVVFRNNLGMESEDPNGWGCVCNVTGQTFTIGGSTYKLRSDYEYRWFAISGLV